MSTFDCAGWVWDADSVWQVELTLSDVDPDGYSYSVDFQHFNGDNSPDALTTCGGSAQKTMIHFVRRRRLARVQYFDRKFLDFPDLTTRKVWVMMK